MVAIYSCLLNKEKQILRTLTKTSRFFEGQDYMTQGIPDTKKHQLGNKIKSVLSFMEYLISSCELQEVIFLCVSLSSLYLFFFISYM